jgi:hypothetical protein
MVFHKDTMQKTYRYRKLFLMLLFILFSPLLITAQDYGYNSALKASGNDTNIISLTVKYSEGRVYLVMIENGIRSDRFYLVKRSTDGNNFEAIGNIKCLGNNADEDIMYSFTDNRPQYAFLYYRLVQYTAGDDSLYSETIGLLAGCDYSNQYVTVKNDIWVMNQKNAKMIPLKLDFNTDKTECNACLSPDGSTLYFVSDRDGGYGKKDIWATERLSNGNWSKPYNLGSQINTAADEDYPLMQEDGVTLFFSTGNGKSSENMVASYSTQNDDGYWSIPESIELLQNETSDYFSVISGIISGMEYTYHTPKN